MRGHDRAIVIQGGKGLRHCGGRQDGHEPDDEQQLDERVAAGPAATLAYCVARSARAGATVM
jgi:hypothetical protein